MAMIAANDDAQAMRAKLTKQGGWEEFRKMHVISVHPSLSAQPHFDIRHRLAKIGKAHEQPLALVSIASTAFTASSPL